MSNNSSIKELERLQELYRERSLILEAISRKRDRINSPIGETDSGSTPESLLQNSEATL